MKEMCNYAESVPYIIRMHNHGYTKKQIEESMHGASTYRRISHILYENGYSTNPVDKNKVIELHNQGYYDREIADIMDCTRSNINIILNKAGYVNRRSKINDIELRNRISDTLMGKYVGTNNPHYNGGSNLKQLCRGVTKPLIRRALINANYTCQYCGSKNKIETHHIKSFDTIYDEFVNNVFDGNMETAYYQITNYPDFMDLNNLVVLCHACHFAVHYTDNPELSQYRYNL